MLADKWQIFNTRLPSAFQRVISTQSDFYRRFLTNELHDERGYQIYVKVHIDGVELPPENPF